MIGTLNVSPTGGLQSWKEMQCNVKRVSGVHDVYLKFIGSGAGNLLNMDYWQFSTGSSTVPTTPTTPTTPTIPTQSPIEVKYNISNNWGSGAAINVTIKNNGTAPINGWNLVMTLPNGQSISSLWNASYTTSGSSVTVTNASYNNSIAANGGTQSFGFNLNYSGTLSKPTMKLNGIDCTVK